MLARIQSFDGSFENSSYIYQAMFRSSKLPPVPEDLSTVTPQMAQVIWRTLLCIVYLESKFKERKEVWQIIVEKARARVDEGLQEIFGTERTVVRDALLRKAGEHFI